MHRETELFVCADTALQEQTMAAAVALRQQMDAYIMRHAAFAKSLEPVKPMSGAPDVIKDMCRAGYAANVGPMAAVAGAFAAHVGSELLRHTKQVIVENGGDVFMKTDARRTVAVYAGESPISMRIGIEVDTSAAPMAICTSSGRIGHSKSFGSADAAVVLSHDACLADACATWLGNDIKKEDDLQRALDTIIAVDGVIGAVAVMGQTCGAVGNISLVSL